MSIALAIRYAAIISHFDTFLARIAMLYGYARVQASFRTFPFSLKPDRCSCSVIRSEKVTGIGTDGHEELATLFKFLRKGLIVPHRLARCSTCRRSPAIFGNAGSPEGSAKSIPTPPPATSSWTCSGVFK
jgi:hypothetical protein